MRKFVRDSECEYKKWGIGDTLWINIAHGSGCEYKKWGIKIPDGAILLMVQGMDTRS